MTPAVPEAPAAPPAGLAPPATAAQRAAAADDQIRVYGHNNLFYWWPVWLCSLILALLTYLDGHVMAVVPPGTQVETGQVVPGTNGQPRDVLVAPAGQSVPTLPGGKPGEVEPHLRVATNNNYGVVFVGILLLVAFVTNIILRGMASIIAVAAVTILILLIALLGWWDAVLIWLGGLDVRMNAGGYMAIGVPLFLIWCFSTFIYDHYTYLVVTRGQIRIRQSIGDAEHAIDTGGILLEKKRNDLFRHWLLGLGTGDLHIKTGGPSNIDFELPNVVLVGAKLVRIQNLIREKEVNEQPMRA
jgi:hypothetical protein